MKLIINADDYGLSKATNLAVEELAKLGTLSSTTVMVNMPYATEIAKLTKVQSFGIGLHFNLTQGKPLSPLDQVSSLVNIDGNFYSVKEFKSRIQKKKIKSEHIRYELNAQYKLLKEWIGDRIDHVDSHQDINKQSLVSNVLCDFSKAIDRKIGIRVYNKVYLSGKQLSHPGILNIFSYGIQRSLKEIFFRQRNKYLSNYFVIPDGMLITRKQSTLDLLKELPKRYNSKHLNEIYEVMCHPATSIDGLTDTRLLQARVQEYEILKSQDFIDFVKNSLLVKFSDLNKINL